MSHSFSPSARKAVAVAAVTLLAAVGSTIGLASATATPGSTKAPPLSHQLCYGAEATGFQPPSGVVLKNLVNPAGFKAAIGAAVVHCNPVQKTVPSGKVYPITYAAGHLACFQITAPKQQPQGVTVTNQFGIADMTTGQPDLLCLPSWKGLTGPPDRSPVAPTGLDHFTCYPVKITQGNFRPPSVTLKDEFTSRPVEATVNAVPTVLCVATEKIVATKAYKIVHPSEGLLCFPVSQTPTVPKVFDENQFGTGTVSIQPTRWLCPPSTLKLE